MTYRLLDLFCGAGGAAMGYHRAGFEVVGVDIKPMPHYPFEFHQGDALEYLAAHGAEFAAIHASPPCQAHTVLFPKQLHGRNYDHPDLIPQTRELLNKIGKPYVIENVVNAPMNTLIVLCGAMFGLRVYRHRQFETNAMLLQPPHPKHIIPTAGKGYAPKDDITFWTVTGHIGNWKRAGEAMGIDWMGADGHGLTQAIPPAYTEFIGRQLLAYLEAA